MSRPFEPSFENLQRDIERYIKSRGDDERVAGRTVIFRGYDQALRLMFEEYLRRQAFGPLVAHFRRWNWETSYNDYLLDLTAALLTQRDWPRLQDLWDGVIAKRRKLYNDIRRIERRQPSTLPPGTWKLTQSRLLETLNRVREFSDAIGTPADTEGYAERIARVSEGKRI